MLDYSTWTFWKHYFYICTCKVRQEIFKWYSLLHWWIVKFLHDLDKHLNVCWYSTATLGDKKLKFFEKWPWFKVWNLLCHVSFFKHFKQTWKHTHLGLSIRLCLPSANTIFTMNFSISQNLPQTNLLKMTLLQNYELHIQGKLFARKLLHVKPNLAIKVFTSC